MLQKVADALGTTVDFLMNGSNAQQLADKELLEQFKEVELMDEEDRSTVKKLIDAFITKKKVQRLVG